MGTQMVVRIDEETKKKFTRVVRMEGKSASEKIREMVSDYLAENDLPSVIDDLWERIGTKLRKKGVTEKDVEKTIREIRTAE